MDGQPSPWRPSSAKHPIRVLVHSNGYRGGGGGGGGARPRVKAGGGCRACAVCAATANERSAPGLLVHVPFCPHTGKSCGQQCSISAQQVAFGAAQHAHSPPGPFCAGQQVKPAPQLFTSEHRTGPGPTPRTAIMAEPRINRAQKARTNKRDDVHIAFKS